MGSVVGGSALAPPKGKDSEMEGFLLRSIAVRHIFTATTLYRPGLLGCGKGTTTKGRDHIRGDGVVDEVLCASSHLGCSNRLYFEH